MGRSNDSEDAAIVGLGATEFSKNSGRTELHLAVEAILSALSDAGLAPADVDGLVTTNLDSTDEIEIARSLGTSNITFFGRATYGGGGGCAAVMLAQMAVATGHAKAVVCYRAMNERSGLRFGQPRFEPFNGDRSWYWYQPFGLATAAARAALIARRYMHDFGATSEDFGRVAVVDRAYAATNPSAWFYGKPISLEDHQSSRMISDPLRLLDCCQESDGAVALVVTSLARAYDSPQPVVKIQASAQAATWNQQLMSDYYRDRAREQTEMTVLGQQLWDRAGIAPEDIDVANFYDHFTPLVLMQLEELGFCPRGAAKDFVRDGALEIDGSLPSNTNGGQLGEAYIHGFNGIAEVVRQVRGSAVNQVEDVELALATSASAVPTSGLVLARG